MVKRSVNRYVWGEERIRANELKSQGYNGPFAKHKDAAHKLLARHGTPEMVAAMRETHIGVATAIGDGEYTVADLYIDDLKRVMAVCVPLGTYTPPMMAETNPVEVDEAVSDLLALMSAEATLELETVAK